MFEEIKKLKALPLKLKESQVAKQLNIDTRTVKKYWSMTEQDFVDVHNKALQYFGGIPEEIVCDRTKIALINE